MSWAAGDLETPVVCSVCVGGGLIRKFEGLDDLLGRLDGEWAFLMCQGCGALHLSPRPSISAVGKAYPSNYVTHESGVAAHVRDNGQGVLWRLANDYLNRRFGASRTPVSPAGRWLMPLFFPVRQQLDYFYRHLPRDPGRLLDVGCGNGAFLLRAKEAGWDVRGIEPDAEAASAARASGLEVSGAVLKDYVPEVRFGHITLSHVFEHLHEPKLALSSCYDWLNEGGRLWMSMPNVRGLGARLFGRSWFSLDPPRHIFLPTPDGVLSMMREAGFSNVKLVRRGRGARSSIIPSAQYARRRGEWAGNYSASFICFLIDILGALSPRWGEEIVVVGTRGSANG